MDKPVLFISNYCDHSKELLTTLLKANMKNQFSIVCVDNDNNNKLPPFVDRVPLMYYDNKVLVDEGLFNYIESLNNQQNNNSEILPFTSMEMGNGTLSDNYSYIGANNKDFPEKNTIQKTFSHISQDEQRIYTPEEDSVLSKSKLSLEDLISKRENDIKHI